MEVWMIAVGVVGVIFLAVVMDARRRARWRRKHGTPQDTATAAPAPTVKQLAFLLELVRERDIDPADVSAPLDRQEASDMIDNWKSRPYRTD